MSRLDLSLCNQTSPARMTIDEESEWDHLNRTNWHGLGLTDPIKSIEVRFML